MKSILIFVSALGAFVAQANAIEITEAPLVIVFGNAAGNDLQVVDVFPAPRRRLQWLFAALPTNSLVTRAEFQWQQISDNEGFTFGRALAEEVGPFRGSSIVNLEIVNNVPNNVWLAIDVEDEMNAFIQGTPNFGFVTEARIGGTVGTFFSNGRLVYDIFFQGDANKDDVIFDQFDIIQVLQAGKYLTGQPATWEEGDFNHDGVFNQFDLIGIP